MNGSLVRIGAFALLVILASIAGIVFSQMAESPEEPQQKKDHIVAPPASDVANEVGAVENVVKLSKGDDEEMAIADLLKWQPTPSVRATYFQSVLTNPELRFRRWHLRILEVKSVEGVRRVTVRAIPLLGSTAQVDGFLDETYEVSGDDLNLLETDPRVDPAVTKEFIIINI